MYVDGLTLTMNEVVVQDAWLENSPEYGAGFPKVESPARLDACQFHGAVAGSRLVGLLGIRDYRRAGHVFLVSLFETSYSTSKILTPVNALPTWPLLVSFTILCVTIAVTNRPLPIA